MKPTLSLGLRQQLRMTPQLQQAIRLLQLSALDLQREIREVLESNPMLEEDAEAEAAGPEDGEPDPPALREPPVDSDWDDLHQPPASLAETAEFHRDIADINSAAPTLDDHLRWQLNLTPMSDTDRLIATAIIDAINADGMLEAGTGDLLESFDPALRIGRDEVDAVLKRIQHFDPAGVAARDVAECLTLQLEVLDDATPWRAEAIAVATEHLELLGGRDFTTLKRRTRLGDAELAAAVALIQSLNPRPGAAIAAGPVEYVIPDAVVRRNGDRWVVERNPEATPALRINRGYASLVRRSDNSSQNAWLRDNLTEARWFLKSLESRHETLLRVTEKIVEFQRGFLEHGEEAMRPLVLHDVAEAVGLHESTVSRVTSRKYVQTPRGLFELKYFFSSHVGTSKGDEVSSTAIRALIRKLTADENPRKPLSDNRIAAILAERNINVARRTVAKYRESMSIPPSNRRKRLV